MSASTVIRCQKFHPLLTATINPAVPDMTDQIPVSPDQQQRHRCPELLFFSLPISAKLLIDAVNSIAVVKEKNEKMNQKQRVLIIEEKV